jgi:hypothetical protein
MKDAASEYLPGPETGGKPGKVFQLTPARDESTLTILRAREDALRDRALTFGARYFFAVLLDLSLNPATMYAGTKGKVCISNMQLREFTGASKRVIFDWTKQLEHQRHIWMDKLRRPNTEPMNMFNVTRLVPERFRGPDLPGEGIWGNGSRRSGSGMPKGARARNGGKKSALLLDQFGRPIFSQNPDNEPPTRTFGGCLPQNLRGASAERATSHPQNLRETGLETAGDTRRNEHRPPAETAPTTGQEPAPLGETQVQRTRDPERGEGTVPPPGVRKMDKKTPEEGSLEAWKARIYKEDWFSSRTEKAKAELINRAKAMKANPKNWDLANTAMKQDTADWLAMNDARIAELVNQTSTEARNELAQRKADRATVLTDAKSYQPPIKRLPAVEKALALIARKIAILDERLMGPEGGAS